MSFGFTATERKPLFNFSNSQELATLVDLDSDSDSMPRRRKSTRRKSTKRPRGAKGVRVTKGRISLKIAGYSGFQKLSASQLLPYIPLAKVKLAAKKVLRRTGAKKTKRRKGRKRKSRK